MVEVTKSLIDNTEAPSAFDVSDTFSKDVQGVGEPSLPGLEVTPSVDSIVAEDSDNDTDFSVSDTIGRLVVEEVFNASPEQVAKDREWAKTTGLPSSEIKLDRDGIRLMYEQEQMRLLGQTAPATANLAKQDSDFATFVKAERDKLAETSWLTGAAGMAAGEIIKFPGMVIESVAIVNDDAAKGMIRVITLGVQAFDRDAAIATQNFLNGSKSGGPKLPFWLNPAQGLRAVGQGIKEAGRSIQPEDPDYVQKV